MEWQNGLTFIFLFPLNDAEIDTGIFAIFINGYILESKRVL